MPAAGQMYFESDVLTEKQLAFMKFIALHGKTYASKSDFESRFDTFSSNIDRIEEHNS